MSTRGLIRVFDGDTEILCLYRHHDCYPEGAGRELADFVATKRLVNGFSSASKLRRVAMVNGAGRMASQIIVEFEENELAIYPVGSKDCWEEYEYHVKCPDIAALKAAGDPPDGLPIVVECFSVSGDTERGNRKLKRVPIPDGDTAKAVS